MIPNSDLKRTREWLFILVFALVLTACSPAEVTPEVSRTEAVAAAPTATIEALPTAAPGDREDEETPDSELTANQIATLDTLRKVDDYPLYVMNYVGALELVEVEQEDLLVQPASPAAEDSWACSLFAAFGDSESMLYGRNFDWRFSPALLLYMDPPDGYASISMVDIEYLGFQGLQSNEVDNLPMDELAALLNAPLIPFDGMNETGLVVGMAAVPPGEMEPDAGKESIGSLGVIRQVLDNAASTDEAVDIMQGYNIDMGEGPPLHYLVADASGDGALVEFYQGEMRVLHNEVPYHLATNFIRSSQGESPEGACWRYDAIDERLTESEGRLSRSEAMELLESVSQPNTQWSIVYGMMDQDVLIAMGRDYDNLYAFNSYGNAK